MLCGACAKLQHVSLYFLPTNAATVTLNISRGKMAQSQNSQEYKAVLGCYSKIVSCVQQAPSDVAVQLRPSGILAQSDWEFLTNPHHDNGNKAIRIVDVVLNQVKTDSKVFFTFVSALEAAGPWTKTIVSELTSHNDLIQDTSTAGKSTLL